MQPALTTTSYAILGHLAMQPWTMYDLAAQMRRNVHYFFPRAESQVYAEPRKLVDLGLADTATEMTGKRGRTTYTITGAGREELSRWLAEPVGKPPLLEFEGMLRVVLSPFGTDENLAATLVQVRDDISPMLALAERISDEYAEGRAPFQRYAQYRSIMHDFLFHFAELVDNWAERAQERMKDWPEMTPAERQAEGVDIIDTYRRGKRRHGPTP